MIDINELRRLEREAHPAPWRRDERRLPGDWLHAVRYDGNGYSNAVVCMLDPAKADLFVATRNALPELLDELETMREALETMREALEIDADVKAAIAGMRKRHTAPVDKRPVEISHDRAPILEFFAKARAALNAVEDGASQQSAPFTVAEVDAHLAADRRCNVGDAILRRNRAVLMDFLRTTTDRRNAK